jgi:hypothetical protein
MFLQVSYYWFIVWHLLNLNSVNQLIFVMVKCGVLFEVRTEFLKIIFTNFGFKGLTSSFIYVAWNLFIPFVLIIYVSLPYNNFVLINSVWTEPANTVKLSNTRYRWRLFIRVTLYCARTQTDMGKLNTRYNTFVKTYLQPSHLTAV